jgi:hypothetical protein
MIKSALIEERYGELFTTKAGSSAFNLRIIDTINIRERGKVSEYVRDVVNLEIWEFDISDGTEY